MNTQGMCRTMLAVEDIEEVLARLESQGATLVGELALLPCQSPFLIPSRYMHRYIPQHGSPLRDYQ